MSQLTSEHDPDFVELPLRALRDLRAQLMRELADDELRQTRENADAIRERCRSFAGFVKEAWHVIEPGTPLKWNWHLEAMCQHLEAITFGRMTPWLIINVPPGSSKSTIVSVLWQAWEWGPCGMRHLRYVSTSFEEENVKRDTRKTRDLIQSEWYGALWPEVLCENGKLTRAGELSFANKDTGSREGVPFGSITGKRGDRVVIDDPHSLKGAESDTVRNETTRLFLEGGLNRSNDAMTSAMVIVMQRLHEDDLTGVLLARKLGFVHLMIPMEFEVARRCTTEIGWTDPRAYEGELMDPVRVPQAAIDRQKEAGEYAWNGQYQQRPAPREGGLFKVGEILYVDIAPAGGVTVRAWDLAGSKKKTSAFTVGVRMKRHRGVIYVDDVRRDRLSPNEVEELVEKTAGDDGFSILQALPQDPGQAGKAQKLRYAELLAGFVFRITTETGSKEDRARPYASQVEAGNVRLVRGPWNAAYVEELRGFPSATLKDQVDASSRAFQEILRLDQADDDLPAAPIILEPSELSAA